MVNENLYLIGQNIKKCRNYIGYTQDEMAQKLGIPTNDYIEYEMNPKKMEIEMLERIAYVFNCNVDNFFMKTKVTFCDNMCCVKIGRI